jgi:predicted nucleotidyltransferase
MTHEERVELAREIARRIVDKYGAAIQAVAIYGSTAKGEDRGHSDLEMWVATTGKPDHEINVVYRGMPVEIAYEPGDNLLHDARRVGENWPIQAARGSRGVRRRRLHRGRAAAHGAHDRNDGQAA